MDFDQIYNEIAEITTTWNKREVNTLTELNLELQSYVIAKLNNLDHEILEIMVEKLKDDCKNNEELIRELIIRS